MSQNTEAKTKIDGHDYVMYMLAPMVSHNLLMDVVRMVGPALGPALDALFGMAKEKKGADFLDLELGPEFFGKAAKALFEGLDKKVLENVIDAFKDQTHIDGKPLGPIFDIFYRGELGAMYKWIAWGMKVQWGKSFSALVTSIDIQGAISRMTAGSPSPITSVG